MPFDRFDTIRIINLAHRTDRRREMREQLRKAGLDGDPRVAFFPAIRPDGPGIFSAIGYRGSYLSHLEVLKAVPEGESVLILEDDCDFTAAAATHRIEGDFDIFYGGYYPSDPDDVEGSDIVGAHCMGFSPEAVALAVPFLERLLDPDQPGDPQAMLEPGYNPAIRPPIDGAYVWLRRAYPELKTIFAKPPIAVQRPSRTDTGALAFYDRMPGLRVLAGMARRVMRPRAT